MPECIIMADLEGRMLEDQRVGGHKLHLPSELPLHAEVYKARKDVNCVIHTHQQGVIAATMANYTLKALNSQCPELVIPPAPVFDAYIRVNNEMLGKDMVKVLGDRSCVLLKGHGATVVGKSVEEATYRAVSLEWIAKVNIMAASFGTGTVEGWPVKEADKQVKERTDIQAIWHMMECDVAEYLK
jgi:ribulose-5-phosphate 4-epimerase/fuculose-1-phosphate aldolase